VDMGRGARLEGDPLRLEQVLANLLNNAAKFTPSGGRVEVLGGLEGETVSLRVRDHGVGLESDMLNRVFDLFVQASKPSGGLGIGLTLARTLVELHGGTIHAESDGAGRGSDFVVRLPVGRPTSAPASPVPPEAPARPPDILGLRVLIVDDNLDGATALAEALRRRGHQLQLAHDGQSAIREASRFGPDLVLLDLGLPDMDGFEVASQLQAMTDLARTRIVAVSGYGQEQVQRQSAAMGFAAHLVKPIDQASLDTVIRRLAAEGPSAR